MTATAAEQRRIAQLEQEAREQPAGSASLELARLRSDITRREQQAQAAATSSTPEQEGGTQALTRAADADEKAGKAPAVAPKSSEPEKPSATAPAQAAKPSVDDRGGETVSRAEAERLRKQQEEAAKARVEATSPAQREADRLAAEAKKAAEEKAELERQALREREEKVIAEAKAKQQAVIADVEKRRSVERQHLEQRLKGIEDWAKGADFTDPNKVDEYNRLVDAYNDATGRFNDRYGEEGSELGRANREIAEVAAQAQELQTEEVKKTNEKITEIYGEESEKLSSQIKDLETKQGRLSAAVTRGLQQAAETELEVLEESARIQAGLEADRVAAQAVQEAQARAVIASIAAREMEKKGATDKAAEATIAKQVEKEVTKELEATRKEAEAAVGKDLNKTVEEHVQELEQFQKDRAAAYEELASTQEARLAELTKRAAALDEERENLDPTDETAVKAFNKEIAAYSDDARKVQMNLEDQAAAVQQEFEVKRLKLATQADVINGEKAKIDVGDVAGDLALSLIPIYGTARDANRLAREWNELDTGERVRDSSLLALSAVGDALTIFGVGVAIKAGAAAGKTGAAVAKTTKVMTATANSADELSALAKSVRGAGGAIDEVELIADRASKHLDDVLKLAKEQPAKLPVNVVTSTDPKQIKAATDMAAEIDKARKATKLTPATDIKTRAGTVTKSETISTELAERTKIVLEIDEPLTAAQTKRIANLLKEPALRGDDTGRTFADLERVVIIKAKNPAEESVKRLATELKDKVKSLEVENVGRSNDVLIDLSSAGAKSKSAEAIADAAAKIAKGKPADVAPIGKSGLKAVPKKPGPDASPNEIRAFREFVEHPERFAKYPEGAIPNRDVTISIGKSIEKGATKTRAGTVTAESATEEAKLAAKVRALLRAKGINATIQSTDDLPVKRVLRLEPDPPRTGGSAKKGRGGGGTAVDEAVKPKAGTDIRVRVKSAKGPLKAIAPAPGHLPGGIEGGIAPVEVPSPARTPVPATPPGIGGKPGTSPQRSPGRQAEGEPGGVQGPGAAPGLQPGKIAVPRALPGGLAPFVGAAGVAAAGVGAFQGVGTASALEPDPFIGPDPAPGPGPSPAPQPDPIPAPPLTLTDTTVRFITGRAGGGKPPTKLPEVPIRSGKDKHPNVVEFASGEIRDKKTGQNKTVYVAVDLTKLPGQRGARRQSTTPIKGGDPVRDGNDPFSTFRVAKYGKDEPKRRSFLHGPFRAEVGTKRATFELMGGPRQFMKKPSSRKTSRGSRGKKRSA